MLVALLAAGPLLVAVVAFVALPRGVVPPAVALAGPGTERGAPAGFSTGVTAPTAAAAAATAGTAVAVVAAAAALAAGAVVVLDGATAGSVLVAGIAPDVGAPLDSVGEVLENFLGKLLLNCLNSSTYTLKGFLG